MTRNGSLVSAEELADAMRQLNETQVRIAEGREALAKLEQEGQDCSQALQDLAELEMLLSSQATAHEQLCRHVVAGTAPPSQDLVFGNASSVCLANSVYARGTY